jgi:hypothetical protein
MPANQPIGNNIMEGVLGVVQAIFDNLDLGKTTAATQLEFKETNKDIMFQQDGTAPSDKVPTGIEGTCKMAFGEITTALIQKLLRGYSTAGDPNSGKFSRTLYVSRRSLAKRLKLIRVDSEGNESTDLNYMMTFFLASPEITGTIDWAADKQRDIAVTFYLFYDRTEGSYGYHGYASSLGISP